MELESVEISRPVVSEIGADLRPTLALAGPVVMAELGWVAMGVVDTMIVGRLGAEAVGAVGLGSATFFTAAVFGMGLLLGLDTLVARAFGAGDIDDCHRSLFQGVYLAVAVTPPLMLVMLWLTPRLATLGVNPAVLRDAMPYLRATAWSTFPLLIYSAFRRYLQAMGRAQPVMFALLSANAVNLVGNWLLVFGHWKLPAMGVEGSGWATTVSRLYMALVLVAYTIWHDRRFTTGLFRAPCRPDLARLNRLIALGLPAALHVTLEVGVFATATVLAARFDPASLAAHQIVLNVSCVTFMIPMGLATAGAVRVGQSLGRRDPIAATRAGWTTLALAVAFMTGAGLVFATIPEAILRAFTDDPRVLAVGLPLLYVTAAYQVFDGIQGVTTGNLRGAGDTHTPMIASLITHWLIGLPMGCFLGFTCKLGVLGLWLGRALGLVAAGMTLLRAWMLKTRGMKRTDWKPVV